MSRDADGFSEFVAVLSFSSAWDPIQSHTFVMRYVSIRNRSESRSSNLSSQQHHMQKALSEIRFCKVGHLALHRSNLLLRIQCLDVSGSGYSNHSTSWILWRILIMLVIRNASLGSKIIPQGEATGTECQLDLAWPGKRQQWKMEVSSEAQQNRRPKHDFCRTQTESPTNTALGTLSISAGRLATSCNEDLFWGEKCIKH